MTELEEFKLLSKGVVFRERIKGNETTITVAQAHFYFVKGKYIGVEDDEMGNYYERIVK